jgi:hypothetical protein
VGAASVAHSVGATTVRKARVILRGIPELEAAVRNGRIGLEPAYFLAKLPVERQRAALVALERDGLQPAGQAKRYQNCEKARRKRQAKLEQMAEGVGMAHAQAAINLLSDVPIDDPLFEAGMRHVGRWVVVNLRRVSGGRQEGDFSDQELQPVLSAPG